MNHHHLSCFCIFMSFFIQTYFSKWIESAKTEETKANLIARAVTALSRKLGYPEMMRMGKEEKFM